MADDPLTSLHVTLVSGAVKGSSVLYTSEEALEMLDCLNRVVQHLYAADRLAAEVERRMNDLGGYDGRFSVQKALEDYKKERALD